jgi:anti-sigma B factor antagonist
MRSAPRESTQAAELTETGMKLVEAVAGDVTVLEAYGRIDSTTSKVFGDRLISLIQTHPRAILVDLENIAYISSPGFHALLIAKRAASDRDTKLALCGVTGEVKRLFDMGGFSDEFLIFATQADAIGKLRP